MLKSPTTLALIAEQTTPTQITRAQAKAMRTQGLPIVEKMQAEAQLLLRLHGAMIDDEDDPTVLGMQEELRQTYKALQRKADKIGEELHGLFEIFEQLERVHARLRQRAIDGGHNVPA